jgi:DNA polymerase II small subunit/DNA polymerase delta subunit B
MRSMNKFDLSSDDEATHRYRTIFLSDLHLGTRKFSNRSLARFFKT